MYRDRSVLYKHVDQHEHEELTHPLSIKKKYLVWLRHDFLIHTHIKTHFKLTKISIDMSNISSISVHIFFRFCNNAPS